MSIVNSIIHKKAEAERRYNEGLAKIGDMMLNTPQGYERNYLAQSMVDNRFASPEDVAKVYQEVEAFDNLIKSGNGPTSLAGMRQ